MGRTKIIIRQASWGLLYRILATVFMFMTTPIMLSVLESSTLGVWLVLLSIMQWVTLFDMGISAGARNEIAKAVAFGNQSDIKNAIATGWIYVIRLSILIFIVLMCIFSVPGINKIIGKVVFHGIDPGASLFLIGLSACLAFSLGYIQIVYAAFEKSAIVSLSSLLINFIFFLGVCVQMWMSDNRITLMAVFYLIAVVVSNLLLIISFFIKHKDLRFNIFKHKPKGENSIVSFGLKFFFIQLAALIIFSTSRVMTSMLIGPTAVVIYDSAYKIFSVVIMIHTLFMTAIWSSYTQAYAKKEFNWIKQQLKNLVLSMPLLILAAAIFVFLAPTFTDIWLGAAQVADPLFYALFGLITIFTCWSNIFSYFLNGIGDANVQVISAICAASVNIPVTYVFVKLFNLQLTGILLGTLVSLAFFSIKKMN
jgi:O-antigen/teichoic acid export membrane protein